MLTLALSSWSFHRHLSFFGSGSWSPPREGEELSILEFPRVAASFGISDLEICQAHLASTEEEYLAQVSAAVARAGCKVVNVPIDVGNLAEATQRDAELQKIMPWIDAAHRLGSPCVRVNTGTPGEQDETEALQTVAEGYRRLAAYCAERGMTVLLENHGGLSASPQAIMALVDMVGASNFRLCPDFGNFAPELREEGLRLMLPYAAIVHAKIYELDEQSAAWLRRCLELVRESGYSGPLSIEFEGKADEYEGVKWSRDLLVSYSNKEGVPGSHGRGSHRVAICGAGMIANSHVEAWRQAGAEVVAVADINPQTLNAFSDKHGIGLRSTDYQELLGENIDIVDVCTPPWLHASMAIGALEAGKHVLCEKPFALSSAEADGMADAAEAAGKVLACRQGNTRLNWTGRTVRDIVRSGTLGDVYFMRLVGRSLYRPGIEYNPEARWFLERSKAGGGSLYDWGVYDLELLFDIFGPLDVSEVTAMTFTGVDAPQLDTPFDVEEHAAAMLKLYNGTTIFWERAWATHLPEEHSWQFYGTRAGLSFVPHSEELRLPMDLRITRYGAGAAVELDVPPIAVQGPNVYEDFLEALNGQHPPAVSGREAAAMLRIIEQVYAAAERSARPGAVQVVPAP